MRELCNPIFATFPDPKFTGGTPTDLDYEKHGTPSLFDEVSQLVYISRDGEIHKCLQDNEINTVEEFLIRLLIDHERLSEIVNLEREEWGATVSNAQASLPHSRMYCYTSLELNKGVVFNVLGHILGLCFKNKCKAASMLSEKHKADAQELLACACKNWVDVKPLDDMDHLQQHLTDLGTRVGSLPTSEMVKESRSGHSNTSFPSMSPTMEYGNYEEDDYWGKYERCPGPHSPDPMSYFADDTRIYGHQDEPGGDEDLKKHNSPNVSGNISGSRKR